PPIIPTVVPPRELTQRGAPKVSESKTMVAPQATRTVLRTEAANKTVARVPNDAAVTVPDAGFDATIVNTGGPPAAEVPADMYGHHLEARLVQNRGEPMRINRYAVLRKLGEGGMGIVFSAYDEELDRRVAIKLLLTADQPGTDGRARMMREAQAMAKLSHPNVVQVYDVGVFENQIFLAMEFVKGKDLDSWSENSHHPWQSILEMHLQAARGLAAAHAVGLVHRDYKPENVLVGDDGRARVLDFGLARATRELDNPSPSSSIVGAVSLTRTSELEVDLTIAGTVMGTPAYMSPEQHIGGHTDARSDQFSFCVALYKTLYQQPPFAGETLTELSMNVCEGKLRPSPKGSDVPSWVFDVLKKGMGTDPDERYPSMDTLIAALSRDLDDGVALTGRISWRWPLIAAASLLVAVFSVITLLTQPDPTPEEKTVVEELVRQAREAGSRAHWVYPDPEALDETSLLKIYALENLEGTADAFGDEEALVLRKDFASTLRSLGDRYWEDERTRSIARAYYTQALMFDDGDEELRRRTGALLTQIAADRERALRGEFDGGADGAGDQHRGRQRAV
ncbi:MAG: serine/threonine-protein kinase, partial [Nannocystaceae bacterium]